MERIIYEIRRLLGKKPLAVIAIDGPCASGKTTLAREISKKIPSIIIHTDDFFLPHEMRSDERYAQPGGNIHYERFAEEVVGGIKSGKEFAYRVFSCRSLSFVAEKRVDPMGLIIVEGSYSLRPEFEEIYDLKIFFKADYDERIERIRKRDGEEKLETFRKKWIPLEDKYFEYYGIEQKCDIVIK